MKNKHKLLSLLLAFCMIVGFVPPSARAALYIAKVGDEGFDSFDAAFDYAYGDSADSAKVIQLNRNVTIDEASYQLTVPKDRYITLDLNDHVLCRSGDGPLFTCEGNLTIMDEAAKKTTRFVKRNQESPTVVDEAPAGDEGTDYFAVTGGVICARNDNASSGYGIVHVKAGGSFTLASGTFAECGSEGSGGCVYIDEGDWSKYGTFKMSDGAILGSSTLYASDPCGGAVYVQDYGRFEMSGGMIAGCSAKNDGGAVYVSGMGATFTMSDGTIAGCSANGNGGAVCVQNFGLFDMSDGTITDCSAKNDGGAVYVWNNAAFTMSGGTITGCSARSGGGAYVSGQAGVSFTMSGGTITGCSAKEDGGGVYVGNATFSVSGAPVVTGSFLSGDASGSRQAASNVYLNKKDNAYIKVTDALSKDAAIGVTTSKHSDSIAYREDGFPEDAAKSFVSDDPNYIAVLSLNDSYTDIYLFPKCIVTLDANGGVFADGTKTKQVGVVYNHKLENVYGLSPKQEGKLFAGWKIAEESRDAETFKGFKDKDKLLLTSRLLKYTVKDSITLVAQWRESNEWVALMETVTNAPKSRYQLQNDCAADGILFIPEGYDFTLDLNGHTIDFGLFDAEHLTLDELNVLEIDGVEVEGRLTLTDTSEAQTGKLTGVYSMESPAIDVTEDGVFVMEGGTITGNCALAGIFAEGNAHVILRGGAITGNYNIADTNMHPLSASPVAGVYAAANAQVTLGGGVTVADNHRAFLTITQYQENEGTMSGVLAPYEEDANLWVSSPDASNKQTSHTRPFMVESPLTGRVGVTCVKMVEDGDFTNTITPESGTVAQGAKIVQSETTYQLTADDVAHLVSDHSDRAVIRKDFEAVMSEDYRTVIFEDEDGSFLFAYAAGSGAPVEKPADPKKDGCVFLGWLDKTGKAYDFSSNVTDSLTLTASWKRLVTEVTLNQTALSLKENDTAALKATVLPKDADDKTVVWTSGKESVVTVDQNGAVKAVAVGEATVTATATNGTADTSDDVSAVCKVTVSSSSSGSGGRDRDSGGGSGSSGTTGSNTNGNNNGGGNNGGGKVNETVTNVDGSTEKKSVEASTDTKTNADGSVTVTDTVKETVKAEGTGGSSVETASSSVRAETTNSVKNTDGSVTDTTKVNATDTVTATTTDTEGNQSVSETKTEQEINTAVTTSRQNADGSKAQKTETKETTTVTEKVTDTDGKVVETVTKTTAETVTEMTIQADGVETGVSTTTTTVHAEDGSVLSSSVTEASITAKTDEDGVKTTETTATVTTTDANGVETVEKTVTTETKMPDGTTGTVVRDENGNVLAQETSISQAELDKALTEGRPIQSPLTVDAPSIGAQEQPAPVRVDLPQTAAFDRNGDGKVSPQERPVVEIQVKKPGFGICAARWVNGRPVFIRDCYPGSIIVPVNGSCELFVVDNTKSFADVAQGAWYYDGVTFVTAREIFNGMGDGTFAPGASMTRAMLVQVLYNFASGAAGNGTVFADVRADDWYSAAVGWAAANGVVSAGERFKPLDAISRQDMVTILYRYAKQAGYDVSAAGDLSQFADATDVADYAKDALAWAVGAGLVNGEDGRLNPQRGATRAQVAAIMMRFVGSTVQ